MTKHTLIHSVRYILPLVVLLLIAAYLILAPAVFTHAASATIQQVIPAVHFVHPQPLRYWRP